MIGIGDQGDEEYNIGIRRMRNTIKEWLAEEKHD
jgi:hypothetical protein